MVYPALFALLVGIGMIAMWMVSYFKGQIPELESEPIRIKFHLAAEFATAVVLIISGVGLFARLDWAVSAYLVAMGFLFYTVIVSPGYFAQKGQWSYVVMFGIIFILGLLSLRVVL